MLTSEFCESDFSLAVADGGLYVEDCFLGGKLLGGDLADVCLELVDLLDFADYGWLEYGFEPLNFFFGVVL